MSHEGAPPPVRALQDHDAFARAHRFQRHPQHAPLPVKIEIGRVVMPRRPVDGAGFAYQPVVRHQHDGGDAHDLADETGGRGVEDERAHGRHLRPGPEVPVVGAGRRLRRVVDVHRAGVGPALLDGVGGHLEPVGVEGLAQTDDTVHLVGSTKVCVNHRWSGQREIIPHASRRKHEVT